MDRPILLVDIDGVCRNFVPSLVRIYTETFGEKPIVPIQAWDMKNSFPRLVNPVDFFFLQERNARYIFRESPMMEDCLDSVLRIANDFEIKFVTAQYDGNEEHTLYWLEKHGLGGFPVIFEWDKHKIDGQALVDDAVHNLQAFAETGRVAICFTAPYNWDWKGLRVHTWWHLELVLYYFPSLQVYLKKDNPKNPKKIHRKFFDDFAE